MLPACCEAGANRAANQKTCFYGGVAGLPERRPNLCGCVLAGERRWPALEALWPPCRAAMAMLAHRRIAFRVVLARWWF